MPKTKDKKKEFLDKFTEELIFNTAKSLKEKQDFEKELRRMKREIATEKLKQKFDRYGEKSHKKIIAAAPAVAHPAPKPVLMPAPIQPVRVIVKPVQVIVRPAPKPMPRPAPKPKPAPKPAEIPVTKVAMPQAMPAVAPGEVDFGKIAFLVRDPAVTYIECPGINKNIIIKRAGVTTKTQIIMTKDEILRLIKSFSEIARIPLLEGMLKARIRNLEISAVVTESGNPSFILRKIFGDFGPRPMTQLVTSNMPGAIEAPRAQTQPMPPITRPFTPGAVPPAGNYPPYPAGYPPYPMQGKPEEKRDSIWNRKIKIGK